MYFYIYFCSLSVGITTDIFVLEFFEKFSLKNVGSAKSPQQHTKSTQWTMTTPLVGTRYFVFVLILDSMIKLSCYYNGYS